MSRHPTPEQLEASARRTALECRQTADELSRKFGEDPTIASTGSTLEERQALYTNWREFARTVCAPIILLDDGPEFREAMSRFRAASPAYIATALIMADNTLETSRLTGGAL